MSTQVFVRFGAGLAGIMILLGFLRWLFQGTWVPGTEALSVFKTLSLFIGQTALQFVLGGILGLILQAVAAMRIARSAGGAAAWAAKYDASAGRRQLAWLLGIDRDGNKIG